MNKQNTQVFMLPSEIADAGERLYENRFRSQYDKVAYKDKFLAIDVVHEKAYLGDHSEDALAKASQSSSDGLFHLLRIGKPDTFNVGYMGSYEKELEGAL